jgi:O-antigen ligase
MIQKGVVPRFLPHLLCILYIVVPLSKTGETITLILLGLVWLSWRFPLSGLRTGLRRRYALVVVAYLLLAAGSIFWSLDPADGLQKFRQPALLIVGLFVLGVSVDEKSARRFLWAYLAGGTIFGIIGIVQGHLFHIERPPTLIHPVHGGALLLFAMVVTSVLLVTDHARRTRVILTVCLLLQGYALYLTQTRSAWIGFAMVLVLLPAVTGMLGGRRFVAWLAVFAAILCALATTDPIRKRFAEMRHDIVQYQQAQLDSSMGGRFEMWKASYAIYRRYPFLGAGLGGWHPALENLVKEGKAPDFILRYNQTHSIWFDALSTRGIQGVLVTILLFGYPVVAGLKRIEPGNPYPALAVLVGVAALIVGSTDTLVRTHMPLAAYIVLNAAALAGVVCTRENDIQRESITP